jgi:hypothetical protein
MQYVLLGDSSCIMGAVFKLKCWSSDVRDGIKSSIFFQKKQCTGNADFILTEPAEDH